VKKLYHWHNTGVLVFIEVLVTRTTTLKYDGNRPYTLSVNISLRGKDLAQLGLASIQLNPEYHRRGLIWSKTSKALRSRPWGMPVRRASRVCSAAPSIHHAGVSTALNSADAAEIPWSPAPWGTACEASPRARCGGGMAIRDRERESEGERDFLFLLWPHVAMFLLF
jgi:hypothetical protein